MSKENKLTVSASPHIVSPVTTNSIMFDVIIALLPACFGGVYFFGFRSAILILCSVLFCVLAEAAYNKLTKKPQTVGDLSAVVTGILLALNVPVTLPIWILAIGCLFSIVIVKQLFGGLGCNFVNPALAGRAFLLASWAGPMTTFIKPFSNLKLFFPAADTIASATPLASLKLGEIGDLSIVSAFFGTIGGCIGETSALLILAGAAYLLIKKVISWRIPVCYLTTFAVLTFLFGKSSFDWDYTLLSLLTGGLLFGAFFMATDYTTTPSTPRGKLIFGIGCGVLTFVIRRFGGYPEGVSYSILLMNVAAPLIEKITVPKVFGEVRAK
jgi:electron transport complex protein RnfD